MFIWIILFILTGLLSAALGGWLALRELAFRRRSLRAQGRRVGAAWSGTLSVPARDTAYSHIEFETQNGQVMQFEARLGTPFAPRRSTAQDNAAPLPVRYDPRNPQDARLDTFIETWGPAVIFALVGLGMAGSGLCAGLALMLGFVS